MNEENLDCIRYKFHDKDSEFYDIIRYDYFNSTSTKPTIKNNFFKETSNNITTTTTNKTIIWSTNGLFHMIINYITNCEITTKLSPW
jgi:hypothetical protein